MEWGECDSVWGCDQLWVLLWVSVDEIVYWGLFCVASRIPLSVNDGSCEDASGKSDSNDGCLVSCSIQCQLLRLCSMPASMTDCGWGKHVSGGNGAERSKCECNSSLQPRRIAANSSSVQLATWTVAASARLWQVWQSLCDEHNSACSVWAAATAAAQADRLWWVILVIKAALTAGAASYHSSGDCWLVRGRDEHNYNKCDWLPMGRARLS